MTLILNGGGNYVEHTEGIAAQQQRAGAPQQASSETTSAPGIWERKADDKRDNPYLFQKSPTVVTGPSDLIVMPRGRTNIDYECEFNVVIGKTAKYVPVANAADRTDRRIPSRRARRPEDGRVGLAGRQESRYARSARPVHRAVEFVKDPMNTQHTFTLNDQVMQDSNTNRMSHNIYELLHYASNILTLRPGDVISGGSPAGTNIERAEPR